MELIFESQQSELGGATTFTFAPDQPFVWTAGQSLKIEVPGPYGPLEHRFSISSAPHTKKVAITTRLSGSAYKNGLAALQPGQKVMAYGLEGDFVWRDTGAPHIFVAAGIGITPFHAMLAQRLHDNAPLAAHLAYGSAADDFVFKKELDTWLAGHAEFATDYIAGRRLTVGDIPKPGLGQLIYLSGPSAMVDELAASLLVQGVEATQLVKDWFTGRLPQEG